MSRSWETSRERRVAGLEVAGRTRGAVRFRPHLEGRTGLADGLMQGVREAVRMAT